MSECSGIVLLEQYFLHIWWSRQSACFGNSIPCLLLDYLLPSFSFAGQILVLFSLFHRGHWVWFWMPSPKKCWQLRLMHDVSSAPITTFWTILPGSPCVRRQLTEIGNKYLQFLTQRRRIVFELTRSLSLSLLFPWPLSSSSPSCCSSSSKYRGGPSSINSSICA